MSTLISPLAQTETAPTPYSPQRKLWDFLTQPSPQIQEADKRQQARFVSALLFFILAAVVVLVGTALFFATTSSAVPKPIYVFLIAMVAAPYGLSRTKHSELSIIL